MKILVTGGAGFIGSNFIHLWLKNHPKDYVTNFDKLTYAGHLSSLKDISNNTHYRFVKGDITNPKEVDKCMAGQDLVIHFAAESHVDRSILDPFSFIKTNVLGTQTLLHHALKHKVSRFHHISTDEVFGALALGSKTKFNEHTPYDPHSPYSASKASSDHLVRAYYDTFGLPVTITNCSNNYGPYHDPEKFIPRMITNLIDDKKIPVYGDGKYIRDWLYVEDHCRAIELVVTKGRVGETYCIGGQEEEVNNLNIAKKLLKIMNKDSSYLEFVTDRPGHDRRYAVDWSKIKKELKWEPLYNFDVWIEKTVKWYQDNEWWWRPLKKRSESIYKHKRIK